MPSAWRQTLKSPPVGAAAGKLPPGATIRIGVPIVLINQTSVLAAGPEPLAVADAVGSDEGPGWPPGRVTSNWPAGVHTAPRMLTLAESPRRLSNP